MVSFKCFEVHTRDLNDVQACELGDETRDVTDGIRVK